MHASSSRETVICKVCTRQFSRYTCPRCNCPYCSLECYKKHDIKCTENFNHDNICQELRSLKADEESKKQVMRILKRLYENYEDEYSDEDIREGEGDSWVNKLSKEQIDKIIKACQSEENILDFLPPEVAAEFFKEVQINPRAGYIKLWRPWWTNESVKSLKLSKTGTALITTNSQHNIDNVHNDNNQEEEEDCDNYAPFPNTPEKSLPSVASLTSRSVSLHIIWQIVQYLFCYCFILRRYNGDWFWDSDTVIEIVSKVCSSFDSRSTLLESQTQTIYIIFESLSNLHSLVPCDNCFSHWVFQDVSNILLYGRVPVILALNDFSNMLTAAINSRRSSKISKHKKDQIMGIEKNKVSDKGFKEIKNLVKSGIQKLRFCTCWANERDNAFFRNISDGLRNSIEELGFSELEKGNSFENICFSKNNISKRSFVIEEL